MFVMSEKVILLLRFSTRLSKYFLQSLRALRRSPKASGSYETGRGDLGSLPHDNQQSLFYIFEILIEQSLLEKRFLILSFFKPTVSKKYRL